MAHFLSQHLFPNPKQLLIANVCSVGIIHRDPHPFSFDSREMTKPLRRHDNSAERGSYTQCWRNVMNRLTVLLMLAASLSLAGVEDPFYGEGQAFYRILSSEPTRIVWFDSMPNPDDPKEILSFLVWEHGQTPPPSYVDYAISIAFDLTGAWSTQNFWHVDLGNTQFPTNFTPTNTFEQLMAYTLQHVTDEETQWATMVSDLPLYFVRGWIIVKAFEGVPDHEMVTLVESYSHTILKRHATPGVYRVAVPVNEELAWSSAYETNSIVEYAHPDGIFRGASGKPDLSNQTMEGTK
jgi:hypothetical protein